jgi:phosphatidylglycerol:prolipoprotein diacylglycerol transferase
MHPIFLRLGPLTLHTYGVLLVVAVLAGLWIARRRAIATGLDPDNVWNLGVYMVLAGLVSAKLWYIATDWEFYLDNPRQLLSLDMLRAGGVFFGGFIGAVVVAIFYARHTKLHFLPVADAYVPGLALGHAVGRLGCFSAGCCWGRESGLPWSVTFTDPMAQQIVGTPLGVALHPTQLYEAASEFLIFLALLWIVRGQRFTGQAFASFAILYGVARFSIEFFRGDPGRAMIFGSALSLMQVVSVGLVLWGAWIFWRHRDQPAGAVASRKSAPSRRAK